MQETIDKIQQQYFQLIQQVESNRQKIESLKTWEKKLNDQLELIESKSNAIEIREKELKDTEQKFET